MKNAIKKISLLAFVFSLGLGLSAQETKSDSTKKDESIKISLGKTKIIIIPGEDKEEGVVVTVNDSTYRKKKEIKQRTNKYAGFDMGFNGFLSPINSVDLQQEAQFLEVNYGSKSLEVGINFWEKYIPIAKEKFGLMTGMGVKWNTYELAKDVRLVNDNDVTGFTVDSARSISKNKFKTSTLQLPLMLETNIGKDAAHSFHLAAGGAVNWVYGTKTKQKYEEDGDKYKKKDKNDFNVNTFQFSALARVGYGDFTLYASYNLTPLFDKNKGPEVYPFTVGLSVISF